MTTIVRLATREDLPAIAPLAAALVRLHHAFDAKRFFLLPNLEAGYERFLRGELDDADARVTVAERDGEIVGYAYGALQARDWNSLLDACGAVHDIFVSEKARGAGVAQLLMKDMIGRFREAGAPRVVLGTASQNETAQRLFEKLGFRRTMVEMTKEL